jgi:DNA recombination protein RmuC
MQSLAIGVGDLKRVMSNVKDRGGWAEIQLGAMLEQMLARDQYVKNAKMEPGASEMVEYAIRMPGAGDGAEVLLPIDAKFPKEAYERLMAAWDAGDADAARAATDALAAVIEGEAKRISSKYIRPPLSTDFAIMYVPTEGLFAEAMRAQGLAQRVQSKYRITIAGPSTLHALLNSLQMGFRTLAIQKRSSEVWRVLGEAKAEFQKYGDVWDKLEKQLNLAHDTVVTAGRRTRAVERKLREVEISDIPSNAARQLELVPPSDDLDLDDEAPTPAQVRRLQ